MVPISEKDKEIVSYYIHNYGPGVTNISMEEFLREWAYRKKKLYRLLGEKLSVTFPLDAEFTKRLARSAADDLLSNYTNPFVDLRASLYDVQHMYAVKVAYDLDPTPEELIENRFFYPRSVTFDGKKFAFLPGDRIIKAYQKVYKYLLDNYAVIFPDCDVKRKIIDKCVTRMSDVIALGKVNHSITLSIHPMDFLTMSDNAEGWTSCMSLRESGCYNVGSYEMMNSPNVVCAFISSNSRKMEFGNHRWNSKIWRQLFIVDRRFILSGKAYPRMNSSATSLIMDKLVRLAGQNLGWKYDPDYEKYNYYLDHNKYRVFTHSMYNDYSANDSMNFPIAYAIDKPEYPSHVKINYSGNVYCVQCGKRLTKQTSSEEHPNSSYHCEDCAHKKVSICPLCHRPVYARHSVRYKDEDTNYLEPIHAECWRVAEARAAG